MGEKGKAHADLEQAKTHKHQHQINTNLKNTNHTFYSMRGDFWGMHRIDLKRLGILGFINCLIELQINVYCL